MGNIKRLTISVAIDGRYEKGTDGKMTFVARTTEELQNIEDIVKNAVGYDLVRGDQITVSNVKFDNEFLRQEQIDMRNSERWRFWMTIAKYVLGFMIAVLFILFLRSLAKSVAEALNPPVPALEQLGLEEPVVQEAPEERTKPAKKKKKRKKAKEKEQGKKPKKELATKAPAKEEAKPTKKAKPKPKPKPKKEAKADTGEKKAKEQGKKRKKSRKQASDQEI